MKFKLLKATVASLALSVCASSAFAGLITNGDFETGDFSGWTVSQSGGSTQTVLPASGDPELGASPTSDFYAFAGNQSGPSQNIFWQSVVVPNNLLSANFSFDYAYQNFGSGFSSPNTLAFNNVSNQQFRVEILLGSSLFDSVAPSDIVFSALQTNPGDNNTQAWTSFNQNITASLLSFQGQNVLVRFAQADNSGPFDIGFDNVSITTETTSVPEPSTLAIFALGIMGLAARKFNKKA
jgi:hypothetical protein